MRWQATRHSALVICVSRSQKPMQSARLLPPPPGTLGAVSLGLPGDNARPLPPPDCAAGGTPPLENWVESCGDSGAIPGTCGAGVAKAPGVEVEGVGSDCAAGALGIRDDEPELGVADLETPVLPARPPAPPPLD